jgi:hypothetical protein
VRAIARLICVRINEVYLIERIVLFSCGSRRGGVNPRFGKIGAFSAALPEVRRGDEKTAFGAAFACASRPSFLPLF